MDVKTLLCQLNDIPEDGATAIDQYDGQVNFSLILLRKNQQVYAYHNVCPHAGRRLDWAPGKFLLESDQIICAAHGATFEITTGKCLNGLCRGTVLRSCAIEKIDGAIYLKETLDVSCP